MNKATEGHERHVDADQDFLDRVLNKLYDFGQLSKQPRSVMFTCLLVYMHVYLCELFSKCVYS